MTFEEWAVEYFGELCDVPEACRDAWNAGAESEREACAEICDNNQRDRYGARASAEEIRDRSAVSAARSRPA